MTPKERAAMQQALEALEIYGTHAKDCPQYPTYTRPQDYPKCDCGFDEAITALREALGENNGKRSMDGNSEHSIASNDGSGFVSVDALEQPVSQEPMYFGITHDHTWISISEQQYNKLREAGRMKIYAAPVRTKDLSDYEIRDIWHSADTYDVFCVEFARAVIAADREKNK